MNSATHFLCEEILIEILERLPVKSLVRFMAVCRRWKSIITGPRFRIESSTRRPTKLLVDTDEECCAQVQRDEDDEKQVVWSETVEFPFKHWLCDARSVVVVGSGNGLVCICVTRIRYTIIIIWNPSIRRHAVIKPNKDDLGGHFVQGFGATISDNDYKYVKFLANRGGDVTVEIYTWKTGTWRTINLDFDLYKHKYFSSQIAVYLRGRLHWVADERRKNINSISAFDLEDEVFDHQDIMLPDCFSSDIDFLDRVNLFVTKESQLAMIVDEDEPNRVVNCSVWVMQEYGDVNSWTKLCRLDLAAMVGVDRALQDEDWRFREDRIRKVRFTSYYKESLVFLTDDHRVRLDHGAAMKNDKFTW